MFFVFVAALSYGSGILIGGYGNGSGGSALNALLNPVDLSLGTNGSIFIADYDNNRVIKLQQGSLFGTIVAGTGTAGNSVAQLDQPVGIHVDASNNIYVADSNNDRVMLWRENASMGLVVAGTGSPGAGLNKFHGVAGLTGDSQGNIYVGDYLNYRVMKWSPNATSGIKVAGTGVSGSGSLQLDLPYGVYLDESHATLYVADTANHRIQRYSFNGTNNVTTAAGGNGPGIGNHQLNNPFGFCVSKKTGSIYVADSYNHRIQRWSPGAASGVTIAGTAGVTGTSPMLLNQPYRVILNDDETMMFVVESGNSRVQAFELI